MLEVDDHTATGLIDYRLRSKISFVFLPIRGIIVPCASPARVNVHN
jgi:hypothetical protein